MSLLAEIIDNSDFLNLLEHDDINQKITQIKEDKTLEKDKEKIQNIENEINEKIKNSYFYEKEKSNLLKENKKCLSL